MVAGNLDRGGEAEAAASLAEEAGAGPRGDLAEVLFVFEQTVVAFGEIDDEFGEGSVGQVLKVARRPPWSVSIRPTTSVRMPSGARRSTTRSGRPPPLAVVCR